MQSSFIVTKQRTAECNVRAPDQHRRQGWAPDRRHEQGRRDGNKPSRTRGAKFWQTWEPTQTKRQPSRRRNSPQPPRREGWEDKADSEEEKPRPDWGMRAPRGVAWISADAGVDLRKPTIISNIIESSPASSATWLRGICSNKGAILHMRGLHRRRLDHNKGKLARRSRPEEAGRNRESEAQNQNPLDPKRGG